MLDEPIAGVDAESQRRFRDSLVHLIDDHGAGVLLVSHELSAVAHDLDRVVVLKRQVLFDGPPAGLAASGVSLGIHPEDLPLWLEGLRDALADSTRLRTRSSSASCSARSSHASPSASSPR